MEFIKYTDDLNNMINSLIVIYRILHPINMENILFSSTHEMFDKRNQ